MIGNFERAGRMVESAAFFKGVINSNVIGDAGVLRRIQDV